MLSYTENVQIERSINRSIIFHAHNTAAVAGLSAAESLYTRLDLKGLFQIDII